MIHFGMQSVTKAMSVKVDGIEIDSRRVELNRDAVTVVEGRLPDDFACEEPFLEEDAYAVDNVLPFVSQKKQSVRLSFIGIGIDTI